MISSANLKTLLSVLDDTDKPLETATKAFYKTFSKSDRTACSLHALIQEHLLSTPATMTALYLLFDLYKTETNLTSNPFFPAFLTVLQRGNETPEAYIVCQLLDPNTQCELKRQSIQNILKLHSKGIIPAKHKITIEEIAQLEKLHTSKILTGMDFKTEIGISPRIYSSNSDPTEPSVEDTKESNKMPEILFDEQNDNAQIEADELMFGDFCPAPISPSPTLYEISDSEMLWISPDICSHSVLWDYSMGMVSSQELLVQGYMAKAFKMALMPQHARIVLGELEKNPKLIYGCGITPQKILLLVENNPAIAIQALLLLMDSADIAEYLAELLKGELSLHSFEVVNRLTTIVELPDEFLQLYISNCILACENTKDRFMQSKLVQLVCVFLQSLIKNKIINVQELFLEIQAFCIAFSRIREAASLFRLLKQLEENVNTSTDFSRHALPLRLWPQLPEIKRLL